MGKTKIKGDYLLGRWWLLKHAADELRALCDADLEELRGYLITFDKLAQEKTRSVIAEVKQRYEGKEIPWEVEDPWWLMDIMRPTLWQTFIVSLISITENRLRSACEIVKDVCHLPLAAEELSGGVFARAHKYLNNLGGLSSPSGSVWGQINAIYRLRNFVAHDGGWVDKSDDWWEKKILTPLNRPAGLSKSHTIEFDRSFCNFAHEVVCEFFQSIFDEIQRKAAAAMEREFPNGMPTS